MMLSELTRLGPVVLRFQRRVTSSNRTTAAARPEISHHKRAPSALERVNCLLVSLAHGAPAKQWAIADLGALGGTSRVPARKAVVRTVGLGQQAF